MRPIVFVLALAACGSDSSPAPDANVTPGDGFRIESPPITIEPGQEITYCYYFRTPNTERVVVNQWSSTMTPGSHHMIMYTSAQDTMPPGTVSPTNCGNFTSSNVPAWTFATQTPEYTLALPSDDGTGLPLGQVIEANTPGYFQMHYLNATDEPIQAHVTVEATALPVDAPFTKTAAFVTYNTEISLAPNATGVLASATCGTPANAKFWTLSTHAHKQAVNTTIKDGSEMLFTSDDWEHPGSRDWTSAPFFSFASGKITYECTYDNLGSNSGTTVVDGPSAETDEMCMATGYYFPATKPLLCLNALGPF